MIILEEFARAELNDPYQRKVYEKNIRSDPRTLKKPKLLDLLVLGDLWGLAWNGGKKWFDLAGRLQSTGSSIKYDVDL